MSTTENSSEERWATCPVCQQDRRTDHGGVLLPHRRFEAAWAVMVACEGSGQTGEPVAA